MRSCSWRRLEVKVGMQHYMQPAECTRNLQKSVYDVTVFPRATPMTKRINVISPEISGEETMTTCHRSDDVAIAQKQFPLRAQYALPVV